MVKKIIGSTFVFRQYMCSYCQKMFFIEEKQNLTDVEKFDAFNRTYRSPCCSKPYHRKINNRIEHCVSPHGIYIRTLKLKVEDIPDEIALVHKRRIAAESGKPDPYQDESEDDEK